MGCLSGHISLVAPRIQGAVGLVSQKLSARVFINSQRLSVEVMGLVCRVDKSPFVKVTPEVMWLTEYNGFSGEFEVRSNTNWNVE